MTNHLIFQFSYFWNSMISEQHVNFDLIGRNERIKVSNTQFSRMWGLKWGKLFIGREGPKNPGRFLLWHSLMYKRSFMHSASYPKIDLTISTTSQKPQKQDRNAVYWECWNFLFILEEIICIDVFKKSGIYSGALDFYKSWQRLRLRITLSNVLLAYINSKEHS